MSAAKASAGCRIVEVFDAAMGLPFPVVVLYPTAAAEGEARFGPYSFSVAAESPALPGAYPLVIVSHGTGGSHLLYRGLAEHLARLGFVVASPEHPRNNRNDNSLAGTAEILEHRPRQVTLVADALFADEALGPVLKRGVLAIVGHSLGGYTALAAAGGSPTAFPHETPDQQPRPVRVTADPRVRALVLLAPATPWFVTEGSLAAVRVPILMFTSELDEHAPARHGEIVQRGVADPAQVEHEVVQGAGHYAFLAPFPEAMVRSDFPPSQDPPGFDRVAFHARMNAQIADFLHRLL